MNCVQNGSLFMSAKALSYLQLIQVKFYIKNKNKDFTAKIVTKLMTEEQEKCKIS